MLSILFHSLAVHSSLDFVPDAAQLFHDFPQGLNLSGGYRVSERDFCRRSHGNG
jgi:hypothetical protein